MDDQHNTEDFAGPADMRAATGHVPERTPRPLVAKRDHFRQVGEQHWVLYRKGEHIPVAHRDLPSKPAKQENGVYVTP
jgi:hypothetical protein